MVKKTDPETEGEAMVTRLRRLLRDQEEILANEHDPIRRRTAARTVLMFCTELRKAENEERKRSIGLTKAVVLEWARTELEPTERTRFVRGARRAGAQGTGAGR